MFECGLRKKGAYVVNQKKKNGLKGSKECRKNKKRRGGANLELKKRTKKKKNWEVNERNSGETRWIWQKESRSERKNIRIEKAFAHSHSKEYCYAYKEMLWQSCCPQVFQLLKFMNIDAGGVTITYAGIFLHVESVSSSLARLSAYTGCLSLCGAVLCCSVSPLWAGRTTQQRRRTSHSGSGRTAQALWADSSPRRWCSKCIKPTPPPDWDLQTHKFAKRVKLFESDSSEMAVCFDAIVLRCFLRWLQDQ